MADTSKEGGGDGTQAGGAPAAAAGVPQPRGPKTLFKRAVALHTGYVGTGYRGSSVNRTLGEDATIEQVMETAIFKAGLMLETNYGNFHRTRWSRASRTDKGVHSLGTVMALRMLVDDRCYSLPGQAQGQQQQQQQPGQTQAAGAGGAAPAPAEPAAPSTAAAAEEQEVGAEQEDPECVARAGDVEGGAMAARINKHLPPTVRVFAVQKTNWKFDARSFCSTRTYEYYLPAFLLELDLKADEQEEGQAGAAAAGEGAGAGGAAVAACPLSGRDRQVLASFRDALGRFVGRFPFHNYTRFTGPGGSTGGERKGGGRHGKKGRKAAPATAEAEAAGDAAAGAAAAEEPVGEAAAEPAAAAGEGEAGGAGASERGRGRGRGRRGGRGGRDGGGGGGRGGGGRKRGRDEEDDEEGRGQDSDPLEGDELDDSESGSGSDGGGDEEGAGGGEGAGEGPQPAAGQEEGGATAVAAVAGAAGQQQQEGGGGKKRRRGRGADGRPKLRFAAGPVPRGGPPAVTSTYYRHVMSFTAEDPRPLVPGGTPCLKLQVHGESFMMHHIRHMIGTAVAVARGLIPLEVLLGSLNAPARVTLPRAPPHTLLLADCSFSDFPSQHGSENGLVEVTGARLSLREGGVARREAFRREVLLPALQSLVELPEWRSWNVGLKANYPFPADQVQAFVKAHE